MNEIGFDVGTESGAQRVDKGKDSLFVNGI